MAGGAGFFMKGVSDGIKMSMQYNANLDTMKLTKRRLELAESQEKRLERKSFLEEKIGVAKTAFEKKKYQLELNKYEISKENLQLKHYKLQTDSYNALFGDAVSDKGYNPALRSFARQYYIKSGNKVVPQTQIQTDYLGNVTSSLYLPDQNLVVTKENLDEVYQKEFGVKQAPPPDPTIIDPLDKATDEETKTGFWGGVKSYLGGLSEKKEEGDEFTIGKSYKDGKGKKAKYLGNGKWSSL